ncbi:MAG TPA: AMP-binding protein [Terriglobales bacterium]|jgi:acyl-CoA synthetase (AMP-forming)/AMP-acid ligase II|nr:AMP-binding protein [Terriglobales bacterium]
MPHLQPFDQSGVARGADGMARYQDRPGSLVEMLRRAVEKSPENEAIVEVGGERATYRQLWERAARVAGGLRSLGVEPGDRVAIRLGNSLDWCLAFFGIQMAGAIAVPVNTRFNDSEAGYVVEDSGSKFVFLPQQRLPDGPATAVEDLEPEDVAAIFYTSGTTGFPKGTITTHEGFLSNTETCRRVADTGDESLRNLISVPLFHVTGCNSQLLPTCEKGGTSVILPAFQVQTFLRAIEAERIDIVTSVPAIFWLAMNQPNFNQIDRSSVRWATYGGASAPPDLVTRIAEAFPNARTGNGFGLTESCSVATYLPHEYTRTRAETVGFAAPVVDLRLDRCMGDAQVGELLIRGPNVAPGYWNKPEATAQTFADGWLHSGDVARIDEQGFVTIVDRIKDMVNRGGENVYCVEVENVLAAHPAVFEVAVVGVPDKMMGEKVGAVVVPKPGSTAEPREIVEFASTRLADFKVPQYVLVRSEMLPRNPSGKVLKGELRKIEAWGKPLF